MKLILYSKPGCHLCEGLQEKLAKIENVQFELEIRDITSRDDWFQIFEYEIPVLSIVKSLGQESVEEQIPRPSPRATVQQLTLILQKYIPQH